jgi:tetratricopeptide (TPR) repeat protein
MTRFQSKTIHPLSLAVERYARAIAALESSGEWVSAETILEVLAARTQVYEALKHTPRLPQSGLLGMLQSLLTGKPTVNCRRLIRAVNDLDARLSQQEEQIKQAVKIDHWRELLPLPEREWLELLDSPHWHDRYDWLWQGLSIACLTASLSLLTDISARFLHDGPDVAGVFVVILPSVVAFLTGSGALTTAGRQAIEHILTSLRIAKYWWVELICLVSVLLLGCLLTFWLSLPSVANLYKNLGDVAYCANQPLPAIPVPVPETNAQTPNPCRLEITRAERHYMRAIKLNPNDTEAHYKLGKLYEDLQENEAAIDQYQVAIKGDILAGSYRAYERLTRLYVLQGGNDPENYSKAIALSIRGLQLLSPVKENNPAIQASIYALHKNRGWAYLRQNSYEAALDSLSQAISISDKEASASDKEASAYCLQAQAYEKLEDQAKAKKAWEQCIKFADLSDPDEATWYGLARRRWGKQAEVKRS